jgi:FkbM family methyltransferase
MKRFSGFENSVRKNFFIYIFLRRLAPFICRFIDLEEGFSFLKQIQPKSAKYSILDVGSNDGTSIRMFRRYFPLVKIIAIDPIATPKFKLKNVTLIKSAVSEKQGSRTLVTPIVNGKQLTQYSSIYKEKMIKQICSDMDLVEAEVSTIVNAVNFNTVDNLGIDPFFIKIDVEGAELEVLKGSLNVINKCNPVILVEIQNESAYGAIKELLSAYEYINIPIDEKSRKLISNDSITPISNFEEGTNNYVWINPSKPVSWHFI